MRACVMSILTIVDAAQARDPCCGLNNYSITIIVKDDASLCPPSKQVVAPSNIQQINNNFQTFISKM